MKEIGSFEAKTHLSRLLEEVAAGAEYVITRRGTPVARLIPTRPDESVSPKAAAARLKRLRSSLAARGSVVTREEIRTWIAQGRR